MIPIKEAGGVVVLGLKTDDDAVRNCNNLNFTKCSAYGTQEFCVMDALLVHQELILPVNRSGGGVSSTVAQLVPGSSRSIDALKFAVVVSTNCSGLCSTL